MTLFDTTKYFLEMLKSFHKNSSNSVLEVHVVTLINYLSDTAAVQWGQHSSQNVSLIFGRVYRVIPLNFLIKCSSILYVL